MSAEAKPTTITAEATTQSPPEQPEAQSAALTIESATNLIRSAILERFASIGADTVVVHITGLDQQTPGQITTIEYSGYIGSGPLPHWFLETGTVTINGAEVAHKPEKYFGRQIFTYRPADETQNPYPVYANDALTELDPGDFFSAGDPTLPGTKILQLAPDIQIEVSEPDNSFEDNVKSLPPGEGAAEIRRTEENDEGVLRILEIETANPTPVEITRIVGKRVEAVTGLELAQYDEPEDPRGFYSREPLFVTPPHIKKTRGDLAKVRIKAV